MAWTAEWIDRQAQAWRLYADEMGMEATRYGWDLDATMEYAMAEIVAMDEIGIYDGIDADMEEWAR